ncbi:MAG: hypothetical protein ACKOOG_07135 [Actinomycetota bacterium]
MPGGWPKGRRRREFEARIVAAEERSDASVERAWGVARRAVDDVESLRAETAELRRQLEAREAGERHDLVLALDSVHRLTEALEAERAERTELTTALLQLAEGLATRQRELDERIRPIGGSIAPTPLAADGRIEVRSRFGNRGVEGFAAHEVVLGAVASVGYRLRRVTDGFVLREDRREDDGRAAESRDRSWHPVGSTIEPDLANLDHF